MIFLLKRHSVTYIACYSRLIAVYNPHCIWFSFQILRAKHYTSRHEDPLFISATIRLHNAVNLTIPRFSLTMISVLTGRASCFMFVHHSVQNIISFDQLTWPLYFFTSCVISHIFHHFAILPFFATAPSFTWSLSVMFESLT